MITNSTTVAYSTLSRNKIILQQSLYIYERIQIIRLNTSFLIFFVLFIYFLPLLKTVKQFYNEIGFFYILHVAIGPSLKNFICEIFVLYEFLQKRNNFIKSFVITTGYTIHNFSLQICAIFNEL